MQTYNTRFRLGYYLSILLITLMTACDESKVYKSIIQEDNPSVIKEVGAVEYEFVNQDNLYENYKYNFTIRFPINFDLDYGITKYSVITANDYENQYAIVVNIADVPFKKQYFKKDLSKNDISKIMVEGMYKLLDEPDKQELFIKQYADYGFKYFGIDSTALTSYNGRKFMKITFSGIRTVNNDNELISIVDHITFYNNRTYHFGFFFPTLEVYNPLLHETIIRTMSTVLINEKITNK